MSLVDLDPRVAALLDQEALHDCLTRLGIDSDRICHDLDRGRITVAQAKERLRGLAGIIEHVLEVR